MKENKKGFTLVELVVVITIVGILESIIVPSILHYVRKARVAAAIADTRTIKMAIETSLVDHLAMGDAGSTDGFNKRVFLKKGRYDKFEKVGAFTNLSWFVYKNKENNNSPSQALDKIISEAIDNQFTEEWEKGKKVNPLSYASTTKTCEQYLQDNDTNFGLVVVYNRDGTVRMIQLYRKHILVTYINGEYLANLDDDAHFVGTKSWDTIYSDCGQTPPAGIENFSLSNKQASKSKNGVESWGEWYRQ